MGRTKRKRKRKPAPQVLANFINLQKVLQIKCPNTSIYYFNNTGWGVKCKTKINEGDILIALPLHALITPNVKSEIFSVLSIQRDNPQFVLSLFLTYELHLGTESVYDTYINSLPKSFTNPYFCTDIEMNYFPKFIRKEVDSQVSTVKKFLVQFNEFLKKKLCPHCGSSLTNILSSDNFVWAWFIVNTRSVYYQDQQKPSLALAPFLDLFNHSDDALTQMYIDYENQVYVLKSLVSYKKHEQVYIKYGAHSNLKLYLEYGFVLSDNSNDSIEFSYEDVLDAVKEIDTTFSEIPKLKYNFIKANKLDKNLSKSNEFSWNFNGLVYVLTTKDENVGVLQSKTYSNSFSADESIMIQKVGAAVARRKVLEFTEVLLKMDTIENSTDSFKMGKTLIKNYIKLLTS